MFLIQLVNEDFVLWTAGIGLRICFTIAFEVDLNIALSYIPRYCSSVFVYPTNDKGGTELVRTILYSRSKLWHC